MGFTNIASEHYELDLDRDGHNSTTQYEEISEFHKRRMKITQSIFCCGKWKEKS